MARGKKKEELSLEEKLEQALVPVEEQPYEVPGNWCWTCLGNITEIIGGGTPLSKVDEYYKDGNIPWISPVDLSGYNDIYISHGAKNITKLGLEKSSAQLMPSGTVCLSTRAPIGYVAIAKNELCTNQGFKSFLPSTCYVPEYLYWYLKGNKKLLESYASGTTFLELSGSKAALVEFPLAPFAEQQRIVDRIESLFDKLDEVREKAQAVIDSFELRKSVILYKAFTGELTGRWRKEHGVGLDSWSDTTIGEQAELITKGASPRWQGIEYTDDKSQTLFVTSENVREGYLDLTKEKYLSNKINDIQKRSVLNYGDILVNIVGASIGRAAIYNLRQLANTNQAVCIVRLKSGISNEFVCAYLNSPIAQLYYYDSKVETARANVSLGSISAMRVNMPTGSEQEEIVNVLNKVLEKEQKTKETAEAILDQIDIIKKAILAHAFRGELGTNDPAEESAVELLGKIL